MTTPKAIVLGFAMTTAAIVVVGLTPSLRAAAPASDPVGTWQVSAAPGPTAWVVNTTTGELFSCTGNLSCVRINRN